MGHGQKSPKLQSDEISSHQLACKAIFEKSAVLVVLPPQLVDRHKHLKVHWLRERDVQSHHHGQKFQSCQEEVLFLHSRPPKKQKNTEFEENSSKNCQKLQFEAECCHFDATKKLVHPNKDEGFVSHVAKNDSRVGKPFFACYAGVAVTVYDGSFAFSCRESR